jgi:hypothetical protein
MAISRQSRHAGLLVAATLAMLFIGSADAWCKEGTKDCDYNHKNGCETNVLYDVKNCGDCGNKCACGPYAVPKCNKGRCEFSCKAGWANCNNDWKDGCEKDVGKDVFNCGGCGKKCECGPNAIAKCSGGKCQYTCKWGWANCNGDWKDGCEKDVSKDLYNCGACGNKCECGPYASAKCSGGKCQYTCKWGWANCNGDWKDGCEKDVGSDVNNCGGCGNKCPQPKYFGGEATCKNGKCGDQCKKGMKFDAHKKCCVRSY